MRIKYARKLSFFIMWMSYVKLTGGTEQMRVCVSRYDQYTWTANYNVQARNDAHTAGKGMRMCTPRVSTSKNETGN